MTDDLARRAVACKHWRWLPGMRYLVYREDGLLIGSGFVQNDRFSSPLAVPCMPHPATLGCLLALVREAYRDQTASPHYRSGSWVLSAVGPAVPLVTARTEARCLVLALEHAP